MKLRRWQYVWRLIPLFAVMMFLLSGCSGVLDPKGPVAEEQLWLIKLSFFIMAGVLVIVFALFLYVIVRYRKRRGQTGIPKQVEGNHKLEIIWTVIPFILILVLAVPTVMYSFKFAKDYTEDKNALHVKVTAHQFWWEFEYPELGIKTSQDLVIPTGKKIAVDVQSADVLHSFWIPQLAGKQDTNPGNPGNAEGQTGNVNKLYFEADEAKVYRGKCAELCGASHALMDFKVVAKDEADFDAWVDKMKAPVAVSDDAKQGEEIFKNKCLQCHAVDSANRSVGPNLDGFADRELVAGFKPRTEEWIRKWLQNPDAVKPGATMPNVGLKEDEITELIKYLDELK